MAQAQYEKKLQDLRVAFDTADTDKSGKLTESAFKEFVQNGFNKPCPDGMYGYLCGHFSVSESDGISWENALAIWKQSNPPPKATDKAKTPAAKSVASPRTKTNNSNNGMKSKSPQPGTVGSKHRSVGSRSGRNLTRLGDNAAANGAHNRSPSPNHHSAVGSSHTRNESLSHSKSKSRSYRVGNLSNANTIGSSTATDSSFLHQRVGSGSLDSDLSDGASDASITRSTSVRTNHAPRQSLLGRQSSVRHQRADSRLGGGDDASSMVVQMLESKLKNIQKQLKDEKTKRKKADETTQQLLLTNEKYKQQLSETETQCKKLERELKTSNDNSRKFKAMVEDDRNTITHLKSQLTSTKSERDEAFKILRKMEDQHEQHISKLKKKHTDELEKQSRGFLQTLGVDPASGKDVREVIKELKEGNTNLNEQVDMLAETLARKEQSLIHALQVLDDMNQAKSRRGSHAVSDEKQNDMASASAGGAQLSKRASIAQNFKNNVIQGLAKTPAGRTPGYYGNSFQNEQYHQNSRLNKDKTGKNIQGSTKTKDKSMEMLNNSLVNDVVHKQDAIDELSVANNTLVDQVMNLQKQLDDINRTSQVFPNKNGAKGKNGANNGNDRKLSNTQSNRSHTSTHSQDSEDLP